MPNGQIAVGASYAHLWDRTVDPMETVTYAKDLEASGVVDYFMATEQISGWLPTAMWTPDVTPLAPHFKDADSFHDAFTLSAMAAAATESLGTVTFTDSIRRGPVEVYQPMLTLAAATRGKAILFFGAGELKQVGPFGYHRNEGLARMEDLLQLFRLFWEQDEGVDFKGNIWELNKGQIGRIKTHRPKTFCIGAGPKLIDLATSYADGWYAPIPIGFTPETYAEEVEKVKKMLESKGRNPEDPNDFTFAVGSVSFLHEDPEVLEDIKRNPLVRWNAATYGRLNRASWEKEGVETSERFDKKWHYALKGLPCNLTRAECEEIANEATQQMVEMTGFWGTPQEVAAMHEPYIDAGATWVGFLYDWSPLFRPLDEVPQSKQWTLDFCRAIKELKAQ